MRKYALTLALLLCTAGASLASVGDINSAFMMPRLFDDDPDSNLTVVASYPTLVSFSDTKVDGDGQGNEFANRHAFKFSADNGVTSYKLQNDEFFEVWADITLTGSPIAPRKEAGFFFDTIGGEGQFIINTDGHEVVAFGGPLPFYKFPLSFNSGDTIRMGMTYFKDGDAKNKIIFHAGGLSSPALEFTNLEQGIITGSSFGAYAQFVIDAGNAANMGEASFASIKVVPEPTSLAVLAAGLLPLALRRRR